jgi:hypothetical protein
LIAVHILSWCSSCSYSGCCNQSQELLLLPSQSQLPSLLPLMMLSLLLSRLPPCRRCCCCCCCRHCCGCCCRHYRHCCRCRCW